MYTATITSKRQITLPVVMFEDLKLSPGQKLTIFRKENGWVMRTAIDSLHSAMGIVKRPKKYLNMDVDEMIKLGKEKYWAEKSKKI